MGIFWGSDPGGRIQGLRGLRLGFKGVRGGGGELIKQSITQVEAIFKEVVVP